MVLSVLIYNSDTWTFKEVTKKKLLVFAMGCLSRIKRKETRSDYIRNVNIKTELKVEIDLVQRIQRRLRYSPHETIISTYRLTYIVLYGWKRTWRKDKKKTVDRYLGRRAGTERGK